MVPSPDEPPALEESQQKSIVVSPVTPSSSTAKFLELAECPLIPSLSACDVNDRAALLVGSFSTSEQEAFRHESGSVGCSRHQVGRHFTANDTHCSIENPSCLQRISKPKQPRTASEILKSVLLRHVASRETVFAQYIFKNKNPSLPPSVNPFNDTALVKEAWRLALRHYFLKTKEDMTIEYLRYRQDEASLQYLREQESEAKRMLENDDSLNFHANGIDDGEDRHVTNFADSKFVMNLYLSLEEVLPGDDRSSSWCFAKPA